MGITLFELAAFFTLSRLSVFFVWKKQATEMKLVIFILGLFITLASSLNCYVGVGRDFENEDVIISRYCPDPAQNSQYPACIKFTPEVDEDKQTARNCGFTEKADTNECIDNNDGELCVCTTDYCNGAGSLTALSGIVTVALIVSTLST